MEMIDYHKLCVDLFGTDDEKELRKIAAKLYQKNKRNAGRKRMFSEHDIDEMNHLLEQGMSVREIADRFDTTRQTVHKYVSHPLPNGCTMRMTYCYQQHPCTIIDVDFLHECISIRNRTDDLLHRAFGVNENPTWEDFEHFLQERCFPPSRGLLKERLNDLGLDSYDPIQIIEKTGGRTAEDDMWIKIQYKPLKKVGA